MQAVCSARRKAMMARATVEVGFKVTRGVDGKRIRAAPERSVLAEPGTLMALDLDVLKLALVRDHSLRHLRRAVKRGVLLSGDVDAVRRTTRRVAEALHTRRKAYPNAPAMMVTGEFYALTLLGDTAFFHGLLAFPLPRNPLLLPQVHPALEAGNVDAEPDSFTRRTKRTKVHPYYGGDSDAEAAIVDELRCVPADARTAFDAGLCALLLHQRPVPHVAVECDVDDTINDVLKDLPPALRDVLDPPKKSADDDDDSITPSLRASPAVPAIVGGGKTTTTLPRLAPSLKKKRPPQKRVSWRVPPMTLTHYEPEDPAYAAERRNAMKFLRHRARLARFAADTLAKHAGISSSSEVN